jgi:hypothetical protein
MQRKVPKTLDSEHFLYLSKHVRTLPSKAVLTAVAAAQTYVLRVGLDPAEVAILNANEAKSYHPEADAAMRAICVAVGFVGSPSLVFCEWSPPHIDPGMQSASIVSLVLRTGPHPYLVQALHTEFDAHLKRTLVTSQRLVKEGDIFVFDPNEPHFAAPWRPADGQMLIMLQCRVEDTTEVDRRALMKKYQRRRGDNPPFL